MLGLSKCRDTNSSYYEYGISSTNPSKNWTWAQNANDGAHALAMSNYYYTIDYKGYPDPIIKASGSTYYIDYGVVDMSFQNDHWVINPNCTELPCPAGTTNQGTWYNHTAATANSSLGMVNDGDIALDSICPKGWAIPAFETTSNKSFYNLLLSVYGGRIVDSGGTNADVIALYPPLSFLRSGYYNYGTASIISSGTNGYYWGPQNRSSAAAYSSYFGSDMLKPDLSRYRGNGHPVRCVSRD